jgi:hypothetical protein
MKTADNYDGREDNLKLMSGLFWKRLFTQNKQVNVKGTAYHAKLL